MTVHMLSNPLATGSASHWVWLNAFDQVRSELEPPVAQWDLTVSKNWRPDERRSSNE